MVCWETSYLQDLLEMYLPLEDFDTDTDNLFEDIDFESPPAELDDIVPMGFNSDKNNCLCYKKDSNSNILSVDMGSTLTLHSDNSSNMNILLFTRPITDDCSNMSCQCHKDTLFKNAYRPAYLNPEYCLLGPSTVKIDFNNIKMQTLWRHDGAPDCNFFPLAMPFQDARNKINVYKFETSPSSTKKLESKQKSKVGGKHRRKNTQPRKISHPSSIQILKPSVS